MAKTKKKKEKVQGTHKYALKISQLMLDKKALEIKVIDVRKITTLTDFFIICTSESAPQARAISDHISRILSKEGVKAWHIEGYQYLEWVLMDYVNIVVHIFSKEARLYYDFERLWGDAEITEIKDEK